MSEWISVKDRLPDPMSYVLTYSPYFALPITTQFYGKQMIFGEAIAEGFECRNLEITHWMPLPELPEVK